MTSHITRPAVATLVALALLPLAACSDPGAVGAIPGGAPLDADVEPTPTAWFSAPVLDEPDWAGIGIEALTINSEPYRILDGAERYTNVGRIPEVRDPDWVKMLEDVLASERAQQFPQPEDAEAELREYLNMTVDAPPAFDSTVPFVVEMALDSCTTNWSDTSGKQFDENEEPVDPELSMFIAKSANATDGVPLYCGAAPDDSYGEQGTSASAWFIDPEFSDGQYFIIAAVESSRYRQVTPVTISGPTIPRGCRGICEDKQKTVWRDAIMTETTIGDSGERVTTGVVDGVEYIYDSAVQAEPPGSALSSSELSVLETPKSEGRWWKTPKHGDYFSRLHAELSGSGTNRDPISGSFSVVLNGAHRTTAPSTWVLGRDSDAKTGPVLSCSRDDDEGDGRKYECEVSNFVDVKGKTNTYYLILTSQPGEVRQVLKVPVK